MWEITDKKVTTYQYEFGDEFNAESISPELWQYWYGWARSIYGNKEQQYYSEGKNHELSNGVLKITARKETVEEKMVDWMADTDSIKGGNKFFGLNRQKFNYTSGMLHSKRNFLYGYFEIRFKAPKEKGLWPAFWLYGGSPNEEIDFYEGKTEKNDQIHLDTHCPNRCDDVKGFLKKKNWGGWVKIDKDLSEGFNVISGEWFPDKIKYYLNGKCIGISKVNFSIQKSLVINLAIPSNDGPFKPGPEDGFTKSTPFEIDYIRVWKQGETDLKNRNSTPPVLSALSSEPPANAGMKKKNKLVFGKKTDHSEPGIFVSVFPSTGKTYLININGLEPGQNVNCEIINTESAVVLSKQFSAFQNLIDLGALPTGEYTLKINYGLGNATTKIQVN